MLASGALAQVSSLSGAWGHEMEVCTSAREVFPRPPAVAQDQSLEVKCGPWGASPWDVPKPLH